MEFVPVDSVPPFGHKQSEIVQLLRDFMAADTRAAILKPDGSYSGSLDVRLRQVAKELGISVKVNKRGKDVYLSKTEPA